MTDNVYRLTAIRLDERTVVHRTRQIEQEREIAIYDLLEENSFTPVGSGGGPYRLVLRIEENRLVFDIHLEDDSTHGKVMLSLTAPTGGRAFFTDSIDELQGAFEELLDELSNQYLIGYQPTNTRRDDKWRDIKVTVDGYRTVRARQGYRAVPQR